MASSIVQERPLDAISPQNTIAQSSLLTKAYQQKLGDTRYVAGNSRRDRQLSMRRTRNVSTDPRKSTRQNRRPTLASEATLLSREGRKFTVTSMGTNGMLYLRPAIRPGSQRVQASKPSRAFPSAEISLSGDSGDSRARRPDNPAYQSCPSDARTTFPPSIFAHMIQTGTGSPEAAPLAGKRLHVRSQSFSTLDERHSHAHENEPGSFRIVIDRQSLTKRPKTTDSDSVPRIEIPIPHYRLGHPYFGQRGTPTLRSSLYTRESGIDDIRSSYLSKLEYDRLFPHPVTVPRHSILTRRHSEAFRQPYRVIRNDATVNCVPVATNSTHDEARSAFSTSAVQGHSVGFASMPIAPEIFDIIAASPNDPAVVRFSSTGEMVAATPSRLIDHITSPSFLDYELLSDFFLTCRSFLKTADLISYLIARLRWAVSRDNDYGRIVRVRTFVALRHWILNYFVDDFISDFALRFQFCKAVNDLSTDLRSKGDKKVGDLKIIGELKKCWRRTCMLYWIEPASLYPESVEDDICPGDPVNVEPTPNSSTTPFLAKRAIRSKCKIESLGGPLRQEQLIQPALSLPPSASGFVKPSLDSGPSPASGQIPAQVSERMPLSPMSEHSVQAASCSIPRFVTPKIGCTGNRPQQIHGDSAAAGDVVTPKGLRTYPPSSAAISGANFTKNGRHKHKRSGSFSDALRDERAPLSQPFSALSGEQRVMAENASNGPTGSLVRGSVFPPTEPYVEIMKHGHLASTTRLNCTPSRKGGMSSDGIGFVGNSGINDGFALNGDTSMAFSTMVSSNPGVKKILGSVRRAISGRQTTEKMVSGNLKYQPSKAALTSASGTSATGSSSTTTTGGSNDNDDSNLATYWNIANSVKKKRRRDRGKSSAHVQVRVDILAAKAANSYNEALSVKTVSDREQESSAYTALKMPVSRSDIIAPDIPEASTLDNINTATLGQVGDATLKSPEKTKDARMAGSVSSGPGLINIANDTGSPDIHSLPNWPGRQESRKVNINLVPQQHKLQYNGDSHLSSAVPTSPLSEQHDQNREHTIRRATSLTTKCPCDPSLSMSPLDDPRGTQYVRSNSDTLVGAHLHPAPLSKTLPFQESKSTRSHQPRSISLRRYASYQSGITSQGIQPQHQPNVSVDAITFSDVCSMAAQSFSPAPSLSSFPSPSKELSAHKPHATRQLRRRPGGNLRTFGNVHELERPRSTGSLSNRTHSITNSMSYKPSDELYSNGQPSLQGGTGLLGDKENKSVVGFGGLMRRPYSLVQTHSSQPNLRPSFEAEVAKLAALPDEDDEGAGIEAALLKLEGKFERDYSHALTMSLKRGSRRLFAEKKSDIDINTLAPRSTNIDEGRKDSSLEESFQNTKVNTFRSSLLPRVSSWGGSSHCSFPHADGDGDTVKPTAQARKQSLAKSDESYFSVPLLQRGLSRRNSSKRRKAGEDFRIGKLQAAAQTRASIEREGNSKPFIKSPHTLTPISTHDGRCNASANRRNPVSNSPLVERRASCSPAARDSFLLDSDQSLSDVASDISTGDLIMSTISGSHEVVSFYEDGVSYELFENNFRLERARQNFVQNLPRHPSTSSSSEVSIRAVSDALTSVAGRVVQQQETIQKQQGTCVTFEPNMTVTSKPQDFTSPPYPPINETGIELRQMQSKNEFTFSHPSQLSPSPSSVPLKHLPFILMYNSKILAQQLTIIEKDALDEVDWKELIELRWDQSAKGVQTWVEYLLSNGNNVAGDTCDNSNNAASHISLTNSRQRRGVDTAIARFNLMVKWAVSECVLTENINERAHVLVKYIHIAAHARQIRNYATMYQITIALLSSDCSRLARTWDLVPEAERDTLRALEKLVQPLRNFSNLRHEMETAPLEDGCIPFIGIYTHDLVYNSQKPAYIRPTDPSSVKAAQSFVDGDATAKMKSEAAAVSSYSAEIDLKNTTSVKASTNDLAVNSSTTASAALNAKARIVTPTMNEVGKGEFLVNFERHRTAAAIVKSLLRLLHASSKYEFKPLPEVVSRCLWMAALPNDEITARSRNLI